MNSYIIKHTLIVKAPQPVLTIHLLPIVLITLFTFKNFYNNIQQLFNIFTGTLLHVTEVRQG